MTNGARYINRILVRKLFGIYDYDLKQSTTGDEVGKIAILYGDNGSGKTTILRTLFHLLAPNDSAGHKSYVARTPFALFEIELNDGTIVKAERPSSRIVGSFNISIKRHGKKIKNFEFVATEDLSIVARTMNKKQQDEVSECLSLLGSLNLALYHLADDRTIELAGRASPLEPNIELPSISDEEVVSHAEVHVGRRRVQLEKRPGQLAELLLQQSLERFNSSIKNQALRASSAGESSVNVLYNEILSRLAKLPPTKLKEKVDRGIFDARIKAIETQSRALSIYGLLPEFSGTEILKQLGVAKTAETNAVMAQVLSPYLESWERRLDALSSIYRVVNSFTTIINGFFSHKNLHYGVHDGLSIKTDSGAQLSPAQLSSGERHLLLLFCNTVAALHHPSIFIIDEPEISLNIKWQRSLISSLFECIGNSPVQYIFATHSLEIISRYRDRVLKVASSD